MAPPQTDKDLAREAFIAGLDWRAAGEGAASVAASVAFISWWHSRERPPRSLDRGTIESAIVDALEEELEDYQASDKAWKAVHLAFDGIERRDEQIAALHDLAQRLLNEYRILAEERYGSDPVILEKAGALGLDVQAWSRT